MKRIFWGTVLFLTSFAAMAQGTKDKKYVIQPSEYLKRPHVELPKGVLRVESGIQTLWKVYSDRDNNPTYADPKDGAATKSSLTFGQAFVVWDETDDWVRICEYQSNSIDRAKRVFNQDVKDYGWIRKSKLLLWERAKINPKTGFTMKCMAINKFETFKANLVAYAKDDKLDLYNQPNKTAPRNGNDARLMTFLFIFDEEGDYYLIGKTDHVSPITVGDGLLGWVHKDVIQVWDQRMALEPNGTQGCLLYREKNNLPVMFFETEKEAMSFAMNDKTATKLVELPYSDSYKKMKAYEYRFPILEEAKVGAKVFKTGVISKVYDDQGQEVFDVDEQYAILEGAEKLRTAKAGINILFVIDGNPVQKGYIQDVVDAVKQTQEELSLDNTDGDYKFEYGAVVYRNESERGCGNVIQKKPLTERAGDVVKFLEGELQRETCGSNPEFASLHDGLDAALKVFSSYGQMKGTNVIVLIGAQGDNPAVMDTKLPKLITRMAEARVGFMSIQTKTFEADEAYAYFGSQVGKIAREYQSEMRTLYEDFSTKTGKIQFEFRETGGGNILELNFPEQAAMPCFADFPEPGKSIDPKRLTKLIKRSIIQTAQDQQQIFALADVKFKGVGERREPNEAFMNYVSQIDLPGYTPEQRREALRKISDKNIQFFLEGYAPLHREGMNNCDYFEFVILLEDSELNELIDKFADFKSEDNFESSKKVIIDAYKSQVYAVLGPSEVKDALKNKSLYELNQLLFGCPGPTRDRVNSMRMEELEDLEDANDLARISESFQRSEEALRGYREDINNAFTSNGRRYYWVPQSLMPN
ncbi:MAG: type VI secretion system protein TssR domain-containing protein [Flavobacteriales bacterium]|jgi:hypothetical protein